MHYTASQNVNLGKQEMSACEMKVWLFRQVGSDTCYTCREGRKHWGKGEGMAHALRARQSGILFSEFFRGYLGEGRSSLLS